MSASTLISEVWQRATGTQAAPSGVVVALTGLAALALVTTPSIWRYTRTVVTIAHEGAHGVAALVCGRSLSGIRLHSDTSGLTLSRGRSTGFGMIVTAAAGYIGPGLVGLLAAYLLHRRHAVGLLWLVLVLLALLVLQIRNFYGLYVVLAAGVAVFAVSWWGNASVQSGFAYAGTWFLLLAAPRPVFELQRSRRGARSRTSDADMLARLTRLPALFWIGAFLLATLGTLALGARWLVIDAR